MSTVAVKERPILFSESMGAGDHVQEVRMSIQTIMREHAVYGTGRLMRYPHLANNEGPESKSRFGVVRCEAGMAEVSLDFYARKSGEVFQTLCASTVRHGREHRLHQKRTGSNMLTERGAKRVVLRWLRELDGRCA